MSDLYAEGLIPLKGVPALPWFPRSRSGNHTHYSVLYRWATKGVRGKMLETVMVGYVLFTTELALRRFFAAIQNRPAPAPPQDPQAVNKLEAEMERTGI